MRRFPEGDLEETLSIIHRPGEAGSALRRLGGSQRPFVPCMVWELIWPGERDPVTSPGACDFSDKGLPRREPESIPLAETWSSLPTLRWAGTTEASVCGIHRAVW